MKDTYFISGMICYLVFFFQNKEFVQPKVKVLMSDFDEKHINSFMMISPLIPYANTIQAIVLVLAIILSNANRFLDYLLKKLEK